MESVVQEDQESVCYERHDEKQNYSEKECAFSDERKTFINWN